MVDKLQYINNVYLINVMIKSCPKTLLIKFLIIV